MQVDSLIHGIFFLFQGDGNYTDTNDMLGPETAIIYHIGKKQAPIEIDTG